MKLEKLIAKGRNNEVYKSGDLAVKVFKRDFWDTFHRGRASEKSLLINLCTLREGWEQIVQDSSVYPLS